METNRCKKYPLSEVLPDEDGKCSLCGSELTELGECTGSYYTDELLSGLIFEASKRKIETRYNYYLEGAFNSKKFEQTRIKNRKKRKKNKK